MASPNTRWRIDPGSIALTTLLLCWPLLVNAGVFAFADSPGYIKGGVLAMAELRDFADALFDPDAPDALASGDGRGSGIHGVRSAFYSLFVYVSFLPFESLYATALLQAVCVAYLTVRLIRLALDPDRASTMLMLAALPAAVTSVPFFASFMMPDIFAAVAILAGTLLTFFHDRLSLGERLFIAALLAFACTTHLSHLPLGVGLVALSLLVCALSQRSCLRTGLYLALPVALAALANLSVALLAFKEVSIAPKRYPLLLARSIEDGPARWYLEENCGTRQFTVCDLFDEFPTSDEDFLWGANGLRMRATPEQLDRIRQEEPIILQEAVAAYPLHQVRSSLRNWIQQIVEVGLWEFDWRTMRIDADRTASLDPPKSTPRSDDRSFFTASASLHQTTILIALAGVCLLSVRGGRLTREDTLLFAFVTAALLLNAAVCGILSAPAPRYQARVVWILPFMCAIACVKLYHQPQRPRTRKSARPATG